MPVDCADTGELLSTDSALHLGGAEMELQVNDLHVVPHAALDVIHFPTKLALKNLAAINDPLALINECIQTI